MIREDCPLLCKIWRLARRPGNKITEGFGPGERLSETDFRFSRFPRRLGGINLKMMKSRLRSLSVCGLLVLCIQPGCSFPGNETDPRAAAARVRQPVTQAPAQRPPQQAPRPPQQAQTAPRQNPQVNVPSATPAGARLTYNRVTTSQPVVAMTFDDGPHPVQTPRLLKMLRDRNIRATFYVIGKQVRAHPGIVRQMLAEGHEIGNHSWSHPSLTGVSDAQIRSEMRMTSDAVFEAAGVRPRTMRPPYGATNQRVKELIFSEFGYPTIMWSVDPQDWRKPGVSVVTSRLVEGAHPGAILLAHDIHASTVDAMPATFDRLLAKGYRFVTVSQLMNIEKAEQPLGGASPARLEPGQGAETGAMVAARP
jgi:peptidoglycan/xylan/chitin deacetylase (PgdA/CDA1 family)